MLKNIFNNETSLTEKKNDMLQLLPRDLEDFIFDDDTITAIQYPVIAFPEKVKSLKLDTTAYFERKLTGIKAQYLMFEDGSVLNIRSHAAYKVTIEAG